MKTNYCELHFDQPLISKDLYKVLSSDELRDDFLFNYSHFKRDGNFQIYLKWIEKNKSSEKNQVIEHLYSLSSCLDIFIPSLISKAKKVLKGRYRELSKLACLDYLLAQHVHIKKPTYFELNILGAAHTQNRLIKFQAYINLLLIDADKYLKIIENILSVETPTFFYRISGQIDLCPEEIHKQISALIRRTLLQRQFNEGVQKDILENIKQVG